LDNMKAEDFFLLILAELNGSAESETRIQKLAFLANKEKAIDLGLQFKWHHYGPFSSDFKNCIEQLSNKELVRIRKEERCTFMGDLYSINIFDLTTSGQARVNQLKKDLPQEKKQLIHDLVVDYGHKALNDILDHIYKTYSPDDL